MKLTLVTRIVLLAMLPVGAAIAGTPAATSTAALMRAADIYAMEAKQYEAAGKPSTGYLARHYRDLSEAYRRQAATAAST